MDKRGLIDGDSPNGLATWWTGELSERLETICGNRSEHCDNIVYWNVEQLIKYLNNLSEMEEEEGKVWYSTAH